MCTYHCLDHVVSSKSHVAYKVKYIQSCLGVDSLQHAVHSDEGARSTYPSTTVNQHGSPLLRLVVVEDSLSEAQESGGVHRDAMIRPD